DSVIRLARFLRARWRRIGVSIAAFIFTLAIGFGLWAARSALSKKWQSVIASVGAWQAPQLRAVSPPEKSLNGPTQKAQPEPPHADKQRAHLPSKAEEPTKLNSSRNSLIDDKKDAASKSNLSSNDRSKTGSR